TPPDRSTPMAFMSVLSEAYYRWGRYDDALQMAQATLAMRERKQGPDHPEIAGTLDKLALIQLSLGDEGGAEQSYRRSLKIAEKNYPDGPLLAQAVQNLANFYSVTGRSDDALPLFKRAAEINANDKTYRAGETYQSYAMAKLRAGQAEEAEALAEKALELFDANQGPESEPSGATHLTLARIQFALGKNDEAGKHGEKGLAIYRKVLSAGNPRIGDALFQLGFAAQRRRDRDRAEALYAEALEAMGTRRPPHHEAVINTRSSLANQILIGKKEPARAYETADLAASALEGRVLANARLVGRAGTPTLSAADRNVFFIAVRTAWAYSESLPPQ
ncbi:MAG: tetratricopeptide repeat protein, partial [Caulobacteraceae bacterium]